MNARMYDAVLGRFLQADTIIQFPESTQGYNRYTYVNNNPLSFTDPSGNSLVDTIRSIVVATFESSLDGFMFSRSAKEFMVKNKWAQQVGSVVAAYYGPVAYAAFQAYLTHINGGTLTDVVRSAAISYVSAYALGKIGKHLDGAEAVMSHGFVGGATAQASGGDFQDGFIGGAVGKMVTLGSSKAFDVKPGEYSAGHFAITVMSGGVSAQLGGGKFEDGARSAAMGYMFNWVASKKSPNTHNTELGSDPKNDSMIQSEFYSMKDEILNTYCGGSDNSMGCQISWNVSDVYSSESARTENNRMSGYSTNSGDLGLALGVVGFVVKTPYIPLIGTLIGGAGSLVGHNYINRASGDVIIRMNVTIGKSRLYGQYDKIIPQN